MATALQTRPRLARTDGATAGWAVSAGLVPYPLAVAAMEARAEAIAAGAASELVWLLEHPALYTAGVSAKPADLLAPERLPVFHSGRGGQYTWHGPGQRVCYVMLDVSRRGRDVRAFVCALEEWLILALGRLGVEARRRPGAVGVWVDTLMGEAKIAALGVRLRRWVSFHGVALNIDPDLTHFEGIVPCGIRNGAVTSLAALGRPAAMTAVDGALAAAFAEVFGPVSPAPPPLP